MISSRCVSSVLIGCSFADMTPTPPPEIIEIAIARPIGAFGGRLTARRAWVSVLLALSFAAFVILGIQVDWIAMLVIFFILLGVPFVLIVAPLIERQRRRNFVRSILRNAGTPPEFSNSIREELAKPRAFRSLRPLTAGLAAAGARNCVIFAKTPDVQLNLIAPLTVEFEPIPLNSFDPHFQALVQGLVEIESKQNAEAPQLPASSVRPGMRLRDRWTAFSRKHSRLAERGNLLLMGIVVVFGVIQFIVKGRSPDFMVYVFGASLLMGWIGSLNARHIRGQKTLVVPGGLIRRSAGWFKNTYDVRQFPRTDCVLFFFPYFGPNQVVMWRWAIADRERVIGGTLYAVEAWFLLRAWLSSLRPPELARMSDLA